MAVARQREVSRGLGRAALGLVALALAGWIVYACLAIAAATPDAAEPAQAPAGAEGALARTGAAPLLSAPAGERDADTGAAAVAPRETEPGDVPVTGASALEASLPAAVDGFVTDGYVVALAPDGVQAYRAVFVPTAADAVHELVDVEVATWPTTTAARSAADDAVRAVLDRGGAERATPQGLAADARRADQRGRATLVWTSFTTTFTVTGPPRYAAALARGFDLG